MRNNTIVPVATFKALFTELIPCAFLYALLRRCGVRRRCPPVVSAWELIQGLIFHVVAEAGTLAQHVKQITGKTITDGALAQRRARLPIAVFEQMMEATLQPKGEPTRHPEAFYQGLRLCGVDGSLFSVTNTPQNKKANAQGAESAGAGGVPEGWRRGDGGIRIAQPAGGGVGGPKANRRWYWPNGCCRPNRHRAC